jgi:hypothetical protein
MEHNSPIRLFVSQAWRRDTLQHSPLMYPFWGNPPMSKMPFQHALFARHSFNTNHYRITENPTETDVVFLPYPHAIALRFAPELIAQCAAQAAKLKVPLLIDGIGDIEHPISTPHTLILRYGGYHFLRKNNEIIVPPFADDLLEIFYKGIVQLRQKNEKPIIGFAGWTSLTPRQATRAMLKELPDRLRGIYDDRYRACKKGVFFRRRAVKILEASPLIQANFLKRQSYSGHTDTASKSPEELRKEFVDNLLASDYGLDIRGDSNASTRLFEMLSLGCVPIIVDTERNFPFSDVLDYGSFSYRVDFRQMHRLPELISQFHAALAQEQFSDMQKNARGAYVNYFRVDALMSHIAREIRQRLQ